VLRVEPGVQLPHPQTRRPEEVVVTKPTILAQHQPDPEPTGGGHRVRIALDGLDEGGQKIPMVGERLKPGKGNPAGHSLFDEPPFRRGRRPKPTHQLPVLDLVVSRRGQAAEKRPDVVGSRRRFVLQPEMAVAQMDPASPVLSALLDFLLNPFPRVSRLARPQIQDPQRGSVRRGHRVEEASVRRKKSGEVTVFELFRVGVRNVVKEEPGAELLPKAESVVQPEPPPSLLLFELKGSPSAVRGNFLGSSLLFIGSISRLSGSTVSFKGSLLPLSGSN
jgi:hypothetical protein